MMVSAGQIGDAWTFVPLVGLAVDDGTRRRSFAELVDRCERFGTLLRHEAGHAAMRESGTVDVEQHL